MGHYDVPKEEANFCFSFKDEYSGGSEAQVVLGPVFAQNRVHVYPVHLQAFGLLEEVCLWLGRGHAPVSLELVQDIDLELLVLVGHEPELGHERQGVDSGVEVTKLSWNTKWGVS